MSFLSRKAHLNPKRSTSNERIDGLFSLDLIEGQKIILTFDEHGAICECDQAAEKLLECLPNELIGQPIGRVLPKLTDIKHFQGRRSIPELIFLSRIGHHFEVVRMFGTRFAGNLFFNDMKNNLGQHQLRVIICPS